MAKKQTRRSISVSRATYERLKAFCETQGISMSQVVENRIGEMLADEPEVVVAPAPSAPPRPRPLPPVGSLGSSGSSSSAHRPMPSAPASAPRPAAASPTPPRPAPMTSAAARFAVEPPPPIIKPRSEPVDVKPPAPKNADQIFTF